MKETSDNTDSGLHITGISQGVQKSAHKLGISADDVRSCYDVFQASDRDESGLISLRDLHVLLNRLTPQSLTDEEFQDAVFQFDQGPDVTINFDEFLMAFAQTPDYKAKHLENMLKAMARESAHAVTLPHHVTEPIQEAQHRGVPKRAIMDWIDAEQELMSSCKQLPWTIFMVVFFWAAVSTHEKSWILYAVDDAISWDIKENANFAFSGIAPFENGRIGHKNIDDVNTVADFYSWFSLGIVPLFWASGWDVSEARANTISKCTAPADALKSFGFEPEVLQKLPKAEFDLAVCPELSTSGGAPQGPKDWFGQGGKKQTPTYLNYNPVIGGMRIRQERTPAIACKHMDSVSRLYSGLCVPSEPSYWMRPDAAHAYAMDQSLVNQPGGETKYLLSGLSQEEIRTQIKAMEDQVWFGPETAKIEMLFTTYNPHIQVVTATFVFLHQNRAGHFHKRVEPASVWLDPYHGSWHCYFLDSVWCLLILKIVYEESMDIRKSSLKHHGMLKGLSEYIAFPNAVDWMNVFCSAAIVMLWLTHMNNVSKLRGFLEKASYETPGSWADPADAEQFFEHVYQTMRVSRWRECVLALYPVLVVIRLFKSLSAQPRLALVTRTIAKAGIDLIHFLLVFACVFALFALSAEIFYGQELEEFATLSRSCDSCFHMLIGDFDWGELRDVSRDGTMLFFWSFIWIVQVVMLNMLLAIIMDVYTEVRAGIGRSAPTLWGQAYSIIRRRWELNRGRRVSLQHVYTSLEACDLPDDRHVNIKKLQEHCPGIDTQQSLRILLSTMTALKSKEKESCEDEDDDSDRALMHVSHGVQNLKEFAGDIVKLNELSTDLLRKEIRALSCRPDKLTPWVPSAFSDEFATNQHSGQASLEAQQTLLQQHADMVGHRCDRLEGMLTDNNRRCDRLEGMLTEIVQQMRQGPRPAQTSLPKGYGASFQAPDSLGSLCSVSQAPPRSYPPPHSMV